MRCCTRSNEEAMISGRNIIDAGDETPCRVKTSAPMVTNAEVTRMLAAHSRRPLRRTSSASNPVGIASGQIPSQGPEIGRAARHNAKGPTMVPKSQSRIRPRVSPSRSRSPSLAGISAVDRSMAILLSNGSSAGMPKLRFKTLISRPNCGTAGFPETGSLRNGRIPIQRRRFLIRNTSNPIYQEWPVMSI